CAPNSGTRPNRALKSRTGEVLRSIGTQKSCALRPSAANESGSALAAMLTSNRPERAVICEERKARIVSGEETTKQTRCLADFTGGCSRSETCAISADHYSFRAAEDRKSTRLNSSHGSISYAVFCLKQKKNKH